MLIEAAIDSLSDAERAVEEGADRLEVCGDLSVGGVTPSMELLRGCLSLGVPCVAMARPRGGSYTFTHAEMERTLSDVVDLAETGAHGVVFGCLRASKHIDEESIIAVIRAADGMETVFHRAFDSTPDSGSALDTLMEYGVTRVLTSGHAPTAVQGTDDIARLVRRAEGRITILPGGGVRAVNAREIVEHTAVMQLHARGSVPSVISSLCTAVRP